LVKIRFPETIAGRTALVVVAAVMPLVVATQVPLISTGAGDAVPLDTWAATRFPDARDFYRARLAGVATPGRSALLAICLGVVVAASLSFPDRLGAWLAGRIPPLSARGLGLFRITFGVAMLAAWRTISPPGAVTWDLHRNADWLARQDLIRSLAATDAGGYWLWQAASVALVCFAAGVWSRASLAIAAAAMTLFVGVLLTSKAMHDWGIPLVTLWLFLIVPWRDSTGVQTAVARWRGRPVPPVSPLLRGLALWLPGLTVGIALAAAAFAKLDTSGIEWVTGGAVRFHFIEDARQAPVSWGLLAARSDATAVALSLMAIVVEGGFWLVLLTRSLGVRALFGLAGIAMMIGFYFLQGVFWPGWWVLLIAFAPWPLFDRTASIALWSRAPGTALPAFRAALIVAFVAQQLVVSAFRLESEPFVSDYSMYSYTWPSKDRFDQHLATKTARYELASDGVSAEEFDGRVRRMPRALDTLHDAINRAVAGEPWPEATRAAVSATQRDYQLRFGSRLQRVTVRVSHRGFDWDRGVFDITPRLTLSGALDLDAGRFQRFDDEPTEVAP
jgi:hypothetical protein